MLRKFLAMQRALLLLLILTIPCLAETLNLGGYYPHGPCTKIANEFGPPADPLGPVPGVKDRTWVWDWSYPEKGVSFYLQGHSEKSPKIVRSISIETPCEWELPNGIKIGSSKVETLQAMPKLKLVERDIWTYTDISKRIVVAVLFEDDKVRNLYLGFEP